MRSGLTLLLRAAIALVVLACPLVPAHAGPEATPPIGASAATESAPTVEPPTTGDTPSPTTANEDAAATLTAPVRIYVGLYVKSIVLDDKDEKAAIDVYYWLRFRDPHSTRLTDEIKSIEFVNGDIEEQEVVEQKVVQGDVYVTGRVKGRFAFVPDFAPYPFDKQHAIIEIEHTVLQSDRVSIEPDMRSYTRAGVDKERLGIPADLRAGDGRIARARYTADVRTYATDFGDPEANAVSTYARLTYTVSVERDWVPYVLKFMPPLVIILCLAYLVFFIPAANMELACSLTVTSILAAIAFQMTLGDDLPNVGYLTCVDKIFYLTYTLIMLAMVQTVWTYHLEKQGRSALADALEIAGRWSFPVAFFGGSVWLMWSASIQG